ncbi:SDR family NAD(P)-dependent oxidoreductase [Limnohabitans sp. MMS-10A-178]|uniref:SDR family NAD(P)-dependent oxidoreductase n=1 Tax=Limnohabitans sp. MMS-10A-178 TaxID=1835767 RepID=UPI0011B1EB39|nr:SDR family NAD(P)-dependent oxidoreductase [Limnohabitans sp. MMS-10A-178]
MTINLMGKTAVITGAASGIGLAAAERFLKAGMKVVIADIDADSIEKQVSRLKFEGHPVEGKVTDVTSESSVRELAEFTQSKFGNIHILFNNAGIGGGAADDKSLWEASISDWKWVLDINVWGVIHGIRVFTPLMLAHGQEGHIINTASKAGLTFGTSLYSTSKHTVLALTEALYVQLKQMNSKLAVSVLCPGAVNTNLNSNSNRIRPVNTQPDNIPNLTNQDKSFQSINFMSTYQNTVQTRMAAGLEPAEMAEILMQGLETGDFYILPNRLEDAGVKERFKNIQARKIEDLPKSCPQFDWSHLQ